MYIFALGDKKLLYKLSLVTVLTNSFSSSVKGLFSYYYYFLPKSIIFAISLYAPETP